MPRDYFKYTIKARHDKAVNTLLGILEGITADQTISTSEWELLGKWVEENKRFQVFSFPKFSIWERSGWGIVTSPILKNPRPVLHWW